MEPLSLAKLLGVWNCTILYSELACMVIMVISMVSVIMVSLAVEPMVLIIRRKIRFMWGQILWNSYPLSVIS